jgi:hypothetical protein
MHMACGDTIVQSGLIVELSKKYGPVAVPTYDRHEKFVRSLFRHIHEISIYIVPEYLPWGAPQDSVFDLAMLNSGLDKSMEIRLGSYHLGKKINGTCGTYRQAGIEYIKRWDSCPIEEASRNVEQMSWWPNESRIFIHDDVLRGFRITRFTGNAMLPELSDNILSYVNILKTAKEIHVIDSAFYCLVNQLSINPGTSLYFHRYARVDPTVMVERHNWIELI